MKAKQFAEHVNSLIPVGINGTVAGILDKMKIAPRVHQTSYKDELSFLINNYEMEGVEIGVVSFLGKYRITNDHYIFGKIEIDLIGFDRKTREIVLLDHDDTGFVMMKCAKDSISFINVLKTYSEFIVDSLINEKPQPLDLNVLYMEAGGSDYRPFIEFLFHPAV